MKKGQFDFPLITLVVVVFGLILIAPIMLKIFNQVQTPLSNVFGNMTGGEEAQANFNVVMNTGSNMWDEAIIFLFVLQVLLLFLSAFLIDTHPIWIVIYVFMAFLMALFVPDIINSLSQIYDSANFATEVAQLKFMDLLRQHFGEFLVGIYLVTGIIMYGKIKLFPKKAKQGRRF